MLKVENVSEPIYDVFGNILHNTMVDFYATTLLSIMFQKQQMAQTLYCICIQGLFLTEQ